LKVIIDNFNLKTIHNYSLLIRCVFFFALLKMTLHIFLANLNRPHSSFNISTFCFNKLFSSRVSWVYFVVKTTACAVWVFVIFCLIAHLLIHHDSLLFYIVSLCWQDITYLEACIENHTKSNLYMDQVDFEPAQQWNATRLEADEHPSAVKSEIG